MNPKERFLNAISSIKNEGFGSYLLRHIKYRIVPRFRRFRYQLVGFLYGHRFDHDSIKLAQLECFCHELAAHSLLQRSKLQNKNMEVISLLKLSEDAFQKKDFVQALSLLDRVSCIDPEYPSLTETYTRYSLDIYLEIGTFENLWYRASLGALKSLKNKYKYYIIFI